MLHHRAMTVTMIKKRMADGSTCKKCVEAEDMLRRRGAWDRVDQVVWADESDPESPGMVLAERFGVTLAPFFLIGDPSDDPTVYISALKLHRALLASSPPHAAKDDGPRTANTEPLDIIRTALETHGPRTAIAFSGAEDVAVIDLASKTGLPFEVFVLDTGRLHPETLRFIETVRVHYGIGIQVMAPDSAALEAFVAERGLFSFYDEGHKPCCGIRKVAPLRRALAGRPAWITGQRRDQNPATRGELQAVEADTAFGTDAQPLMKINPLAAWTSEDVWRYLRDHDVPTNPLHAEGYPSIGCAPCTRPVGPDQHEREGRWWWENDTKRECGLHTASAANETS